MHKPGHIATVTRVCVIGFLLPALTLTAFADTLNITDGIHTYAGLTDTTVTLSGVSELHITATTNPIPGCVIHLNSPDAWFFMDNIKPSTVNSAYLGQIRVNNAPADRNSNVRVAQYVNGTVVIPHGPDFRPLHLYSDFYYSGTTRSPELYTLHTGSALGPLHDTISAFTLKRGYMAVFAQNTSGTGAGKVYIAQDWDIHVPVIPSNLNDTISFVRVFPWRWTSKKGSCDVDPPALNATWHYNWDINKNSTPDWQYVAIKQQPYWPGLDQDWQTRGVNHLLGFNEPDNPKEDAYKNLNPPGSTESAIGHWPSLLAAGLRVGAPAVTDGGSGWLFDFMNQADAAGLRIDYVPVHYYRAYWNNDDPAGAANQLYNYLKSIHDVVQRPIWLTEFNNGANWTNPDDPSTDPSYAQNAAIIEAMITMMDNTPWIERYAIYSRVEYMRQTHYDEGGLTPMGQMYRDHQAPMAYRQPPAEGVFGCACYAMENNPLDSLAYANDAAVYGSPAYPTGHIGQAMDLDGADDYMHLPANLGDGRDFTFAAWVYWDGGGNWQRIFDLGSSTSRYMFLTPATTGGVLRFAITTGGYNSEQRLETAPLATGAWQHVAVTLSDNTGRLYLNGVQVDSNTNMTLNPADLNTTMNYLGKSQFSADPLFNGRLDEVRFGDYALTAAEIAALYNGTPGNFAPAFNTPALSKPLIVPGSAYRQTLFYDASDIDADGMLTFTKMSGPAWLTVALDGTLSGTPTVHDAGDNEFMVRVTDAAGAAAEAALTVPVAAFGLQTHYRFEGDTRDDTGFYDAAVTGSWIYDDGYTGQAMALEGVDSFVTLPSELIYSDDLTIAAWINWNGGSSWQRIFDFGNDTSQYLFLTPRSDSNTLRFAIKNGGSEQQLNASQLPAGQWTHVAVTLDGDSGTLYVNGTAVDTNPSMILDPTDLSPLYNYIGKSQWPDPLFSGRIDDFRIYNHALTAAEIAAVAAQTAAPSTKRTILGHTAGSEEPGNPAVNSYDDNGSTRWANTGTVPGAWIEYDLGTETVIDRVQIKFYHGQTRTFPLRIEVDGVTVFNGQTDTTDGFWAASFDPVSGRYVRITMTGSNSDGSGWFSVFETQLWASAFPPAFVADPVLGADAVEGAAYTGLPLTNVVQDHDGIETLTFDKESGPDWLAVESDGTLSGIPGDTNVGANTFTVRVMDTTGQSDTAQLIIHVMNTYTGVRGVEDLAGMAVRWLAQDCTDVPTCGGADLTGDARVDMTDLKRLSENWLANDTYPLPLSF